MLQITSNKTFRKIMLGILPLLLAAVLGISPLSKPGEGSDSSPETKPTLNAAAELCQGGKYDEGIAMLEKLLSRKEYGKGSVYYNLGAAEEARGNSGKALLQYLRGARIDPLSRELREGIARTRPAQNELPLFWKMALWNRWIPWNVTLWLGAAALGLFWIMLGLALFFSSPRLRRCAKLMLAPVLLLGFLACANLALERFAPLGVVISKECILRSGLSSKSTSLFTLPEGAVVRILKTLGDHVLLGTPQGNRGWAPAKEVPGITEPKNQPAP